MYQGLKGSKVIIKQRDNLMERQISILEKSKYEEFKAICDDTEGNGISDFEADHVLGRSESDQSWSHIPPVISHKRQKSLSFKQALWQ